MASSGMRFERYTSTKLRSFELSPEEAYTLYLASAICW